MKMYTHSEMMFSLLQAALTFQEIILIQFIVTQCQEMNLELQFGEDSN